MKYKLPKLKYGYSDLEPIISEKQLKIHHQIHHQGYVDGANKSIDRMKEARNNDSDLDMKATIKELSFHIGGHILHAKFWSSMAPEKKGGGGEPEGKIKDLIEKEYLSFDRFKKEFSEVAVSVEGSGWAVLGYCEKCNEIKIMQIEKHNVNIMPQYKILLCVDVWEHAYYLDYQNKRGNFIESYWKIVNWKKVEERLA